jgi:hypothetical protein
MPLGESEVQGSEGSENENEKGSGVFDASAERPSLAVVREDVRKRQQRGGHPARDAKQ